jgi:hypothetical protein
MNMTSLKFNKCLHLLTFFILSTTLTFGQRSYYLSKNQLGGHQNHITTHVPFLAIAPDSRATGMGDVGAATSPDANAIHWNASKLAFSEESAGFSFTRTPWLRQLVPGMSLNYLAGYGKIKEKSAIGGSVRYLKIGDVFVEDYPGMPLIEFNHYEFAVDGFFATQLSKKSSLAVSMRFIYSNLYGNRMTNNFVINPATAVAGDISYFFQDKYKDRKNLKYAFGATITNLGSKLSYMKNSEGDFIPINLRLGTSWTYDIDEFNSITFSGDINKLLVPTRPIYYPSQSNPGRDSINPTTNRPEIKEGMDPNVLVMQGVSQSFYDAPGGFREEISEIMLSIGIEFWHKKKWAFRTGYFGEAENKGNRKYFTTGLGFRHKSLGVDASYLLPVQQNHPLKNQMRFSFLLDLASSTKVVVVE